MQSNLDITLRYKTLCSLAVSHDYFKGGDIKRLFIEPTLETRLWLRNNRLIYRQKPNGFLLGYLNKDSSRFVSNKFNKEKLSFVISTTDNYFDTYSSYKFRRMNEIIYLSNQNEGISLSKNDTVSNEDKIPCFPPRFIYNISDNFLEKDDNKPVVIRDYNMNDVWEATNNQRLTINLAGNENGIYHIQLGKKNIESFYLLPKVPRGIIGVVDLYVKDIPIEDEIKYEVRFGAKEAIWRYYFVQYKASSVYERIKIEPVKKGLKVPFSSPKEVIIHSGQKAIMIESKRPIVVQENAPYRFQLKAFKKNTQERITVQLPNPSYKEITVDRATNVISAQIFMKI